jgi:hypothetical protein
MTQRRDLKRRVRERQALTGEAYVTALRHIRDAAPPSPAVPAVPVVELIDLTELGAALGLHCQVSMYPDLLGRIDVGAALLRFRHALHQPSLALMRAIVLDGEPLYAPIDVSDTHEFYHRVQRGLSGVSASGQLLALTVDGALGPVLAVFILWMVPIIPQLGPSIPQPVRPPRLLLALGETWRQPWRL